MLCFQIEPDIADVMVMVFQNIWSFRKFRYCHFRFEHTQKYGHLSSGAKFTCPSDGITQRLTVDLNKRLPQHESLYSIGLISARIDILHIGNFFTKSNEFECNDCRAVFVLLKISFWKMYVWDPPWGISILADFRPMEYKLSCCGSLWSR